MKESIDKVYTNSGNQDIIDLIDKPNGIVLDVGCGGGTLAKILTEKQYIIDGITISPEEYKAAKQYTRNVFIHNLENGLPDDILGLQYDYVVCSHVLEHIVYPARLIADIYKVLKPGGYLLVALPNIMHYKSRMNLIAGNFKYEEAGIWDYTHVKWYTFHTAQKLLLQHQFFIEWATVTGELPFNSLFSKVLPSRFRQKVFRLLTKISKGFFGYQILIKARKD